MLITDFLNKHNILWEPIGLDGKVPKVIGNYKPDPTDYKLDSLIIKERQTTPSEYIAIFTNEIAQYDIDIEDYSNEILEVLPYFKSVTKGLNHYFIKIIGATLQRYTPIAGDILTGQWSYCKRNAKVFNSENEIKSFSIDSFEKRINPVSFKAVLKKLKENIDEYDYDTWLRICFGIYNTAYENLFKEPLNYVIEFSKDGKKYDDVAKNTINSIRYNQNGVKFGSLKLILEEPVQKKEKTSKKKNDDEDINEDNCVDYLEWKKDWEKHVFSCKQRGLICHDLYKTSHIQEAKYGTKYFLQDNEFVKLSSSVTNIGIKKQKLVSCISLWDLDPLKREYMDYNFGPPPFIVPNGYNYYNTWKDFELREYIPKIELDPEHCIKVYIDFQRHLSSNDDSVLDYLIQQDAHLIQRPGEKPGVCTVIFGDQGTGKGTKAAFYVALLGQDKVLQTSDINQVLGQFTRSVSKKLIIILDEVASKEMKSKDGALKYIITEPTTKIEEKGKDAREEYSFVRIHINTNSEYVVVVSNSDRRYFIISPEIYDPIQYSEFPHNIFDLISSKDAMKYVFNYLESINLKYKNMSEWQKNRPLTSAYDELKEASIPIEVRFLHQFVNNNEIEKDVFVITLNLLYSYFQTYLGENTKFEMIKDVFSKKIRKFKTIGSIRVTKNGKKEVEFTISRLKLNNEMLLKGYKFLE